MKESLYCIGLGASAGSFESMEKSFYFSWQIIFRKTETKKYLTSEKDEVLTIINLIQ